MRYRFAKPARAQLLDELLMAGLTPATVLVEMDGGPDYTTNPGTTCWVECAESQYNAVAAVVAAHDAAAIDAAAAQAVQDAQTDLATRSTIVSTLQNDAAILADTTTYPTLTQGQIRTILYHVVRCLLVVIRILARHND